MDEGERTPQPSVEAARAALAQAARQHDFRASGVPEVGARARDDGPGGR